MTPEQEKLIRKLYSDTAYEPFAALAQVVLELAESHRITRESLGRAHNRINELEPPEFAEVEEHSFTGIRGKSRVESMREHIDRVRERTKEMLDEATDTNRLDNIAASIHECAPDHSTQTVSVGDLRFLIEKARERHTAPPAPEQPKRYTGPIEPGMIFEWPHTPSGSVVSRLIVDRLEGFSVWVRHEDSETVNRLDLDAFRRACRKGPTFIPETEAERTARHLDEQGDASPSPPQFNPLTHKLSPEELDEVEEAMTGRNSTHDSRAQVRVRDELADIVARYPAGGSLSAHTIVDRILDRLSQANLDEPAQPSLSKDENITRWGNVDAFLTDVKNGVEG